MRVKKFSDNFFSLLLVFQSVSKKCDKYPCTLFIQSEENILQSVTGGIDKRSMTLVRLKVIVRQFHGSFKKIFSNPIAKIATLTERKVGIYGRYYLR